MSLVRIEVTSGMDPRCHGLFGSATVAAPDIEIITLLDDKGAHGASETSVTNDTLQFTVAWSRLTSVIQGTAVTAATAGSSVGQRSVWTLLSTTGDYNGWPIDAATLSASLSFSSYAATEVALLTSIGAGEVALVGTEDVPFNMFGCCSCIRQPARAGRTFPWP